WSSDVCSSDLTRAEDELLAERLHLLVRNGRQRDVVVQRLVAIGPALVVHLGNRAAVVNASGVNQVVALTVNAQRDNPPVEDAGALLDLVAPLTVRADGVVRQVPTRA